MNADERRKIKAVQCFMPITHEVNELAPGRYRFIGVPLKGWRFPYFSLPYSES